MLQLFSRHRSHGRGRLRRGQLGFGLALKDGVRVFQGDDAGHAVSGIGAGEIVVLFLQDPQLTGIEVYELGEFGLEARDMGAPLLGEDVVAEAVDIFLKGVHELQAHLHLGALVAVFEVDHRGHRGLSLVEALHIGFKPLRLMEGLAFLRFSPQIRIFDGELRVEVGCLMEPGFQPVRPELGPFEDLLIRHEIDAGAGML